MRVTFTKESERRYLVAIERRHEPRLVPIHGPGNDSYLPHDLAHLVTEIEVGIRLGVFGQLAAGATGIFPTEAGGPSLRNKRRDARIGSVGRGEMDRSEKLTYLCVSEWERRAGRRARVPPGVDTTLATRDEIERTVRALDREARRWHALPIGGSLAYDWPPDLEVDIAHSRRGRRDDRRLRQLSGRRDNRRRQRQLWGARR
jgi:hypothetical protein